MHENTNESHDTEKAIAQKSRLGLILFFIYSAVYAGFVVIGVMEPQLLGKKIMGQNLSVLYGIGLIVLAIIMGVLYHYFCSKFEDRFNSESVEK